MHFRRGKNEGIAKGAGLFCMQGGTFFGNELINTENSPCEAGFHLPFIPPGECVCSDGVTAFCQFDTEFNFHQGNHAQVAGFDELSSLPRRNGRIAFFSAPQLGYHICIKQEFRHAGRQVPGFL